jgi:hypothetical protein
MQKYTVKLLQAFLIILNVKTIFCTVFRLSAYDFRSKGWNGIYCQPKCAFSCELICVAETLDTWQGCIFADPNGYPCIGKYLFIKENKSNLILN